MRWSRTLIPTLRKPPEGAEIASHVLMLRSGMIAQVIAGAYAYLPLGLRTLRKAQSVVRRELEAAGAVEVSMPAFIPPSLWERTGRLDQFGDELVELALRRQGRSVRAILSPAHEEVLTHLVAGYVTSHRQLPLVLYQIGDKFRSEQRPRFGLLRTCQYLTADAYSFDPSPESLDNSYDKMHAALRRALERLGLEPLSAEAESDPAGGGVSHELVVPAESGEHVIAHCAVCGYTATLQRAEVGPIGVAPGERPPEPIRQVDTPGATTIDQLSALLGCRPEGMIKTLIYLADKKPVAVLVRGDHEASEDKIRRALGVRALELAPPEVIGRVTGAPVGFAGPVGLAERIPLWADRSVRLMPWAVTGANRADAHLTGVCPQRDFHADKYADLRTVVDGDPCPRCNATVALRPCIELGHLFKLGARFSEAFGARFVDDQEQPRPIAMGVYTLGLSRLVAAVAQTSHDDRGIVWPLSLAPCEVLVMPLNMTDRATADAANRLYQDLATAGIDVLLDDRDQRAGVKFYDADLLGIPLRAVLGPKRVVAGQIEIRWRWDAEPEVIPLDDAAQRIAERIREERQMGVRFATWRAP